VRLIFANFANSMKSRN